jgi:hypothetical protein
VDGLVLTLQMAGINNRNFLMRDEQTGSFWQQISGRAIAGPLKGRQLRLIGSEETTFALWKAEQPAGTVLLGLAADRGRYGSTAMEDLLGEVPEPLRAEGLAPREPVLSLSEAGISRAWPEALVVKETLLRDQLGELPVLLLLGPDGVTVRAFRARVSSSDDPPEFYRTGDGAMLDERTGSRWNFQGCAVAGPLAGQCLQRLELGHDFWFAWKRYHPEGSLYRKPR